MKYLMFVTAIVGFGLSWLVRMPDSNTYQGERVAMQVVAIVITLALLLLEALIWVL